MGGRLDRATGMSILFRDHADYHLAVLFDGRAHSRTALRGGTATVPSRFPSLSP